MLCLPTRVCAQPGLAVRAVSAIGAHLELAGGLGMIGLGILRSPDALHSLGLRTEGHSLSRPCASQQGWRRSVVWVSSEQPKRAPVAQLRQASPLCFGMCSGSTGEQPDCEQPASRAAAVQDEQLPRAVSATGFGGNSRTKKRGFPENACGFVEVIPGLHRHAKGGGSISISDH